MRGRMNAIALTLLNSAAASITASSARPPELSVHNTLPQRQTKHTYAPHSSNESLDLPAGRRAKDEMNGTPRLRSAYPATPRKDADTPVKRPTKPDAPKNSPESSENDGPLISLSVLDAPTQRFYVSAFYIGLTAWRLFDYSKLIANETESLWLFLKWTAVDVAFLYGIPELRIPWLEWSSTTMTVIFMLHGLLNAVLMFRIPIPLEAWVMAFARLFYDRELSVSERRVKPASLIQNSSLILGKQIIHILPEGSAMLNPHEDSFCIDPSKPSAMLPILVNQTSPILIEIVRIDLETNVNETITISSRDAKKMKKQADKELGKKDTTSPRMLHFPVKQTGLYRLQKVVDESNLEVQRRLSDTLVVSCPSGSVKSVSQHKCRGELSDFYFQVDATPPLKVKYSKTINREDQSYVFLTVHPENLDSPLSRQRTSGALVKAGSDIVDISWARTRHIEIPVNETLGVGGGWQYSIDEVHDGCGNFVNYTRPEDLGQQRPIKGASLEQIFTVHERPRAVMEECNPQKPLNVAKGKSLRLPIWFNPTRQHDTKQAKHHITYAFTPELDESTEGLDQSVTKLEHATFIGAKGPEIHQPGLYSLVSVSTDYCAGEVMEPSSCSLSNPPEPSLSIASHEIPHQCAGNSIGLRVNLDLIGTPPFYVSYNILRQGGRTEPKNERVDGMRTQLEFKPQQAGQYAYEFLDISDAVYKSPRLIKHPDLRLEQDVKPTAWARFAHRSPRQNACIQEPASFAIHLSGELPWKLEYDLIHEGKRTKHSVKDIMSSPYTLVTSDLIKGGQYSLSLTGVTDASDCKIDLEEDARIDVRLQRPSAAFGYIEGSRSAITLQGKNIDLPLRLSGEPPWTITYSKASEGDDRLYRKQLETSNDLLVADAEDIYEIREVSDRVCPGTVDVKANKFEVQWVPRPTIHATESSAIQSHGDKLIKKAVCEGDQDAMEVLFSGNPPYNIKYDVHMRPERGSASVSSKVETYGLHTATIRMVTSQAGQFEYKVTELGDQLYDHDPRWFSPLNIQQKVYSRPSASFAKPGKTYRYCKEQAVGDEVIPIVLTGSPPFALEISIKQHSSPIPETVSVPNIEGKSYDFHIPHSALSLGSHAVTIRKVTDSHGCQRVTEVNGPTTLVNVVDVPSISPTESKTDYCVGDRISYTLAGASPFNVYYSFEGTKQKASVSTNSFRRIAEKPGNFTITAISDKASGESCKAHTKHTKIIHPLPSVRISKGRTAEVDIHEGGEAEMMFEFGGTPPFEFTWTRSTNAVKGKKPAVLETKTDVSHDYAKMVRVSEEGTYEVIAVRDSFCGVETPQTKKKGRAEQQLLTF